MRTLLLMSFLFSFSAFAKLPQTTFNKDILPIFSMYCASCHGSHGSSVMPNILDYQVAFIYRERIREGVVEKQTMPKKGVLSKEQIELIRKWLDEGAN